MFVRPTYTITGLHYNYRCPNLSAANVSKHYLQNHWVTLHLLVPYLKSSLCSYTLSTKSLGYATLVGIQPFVQPMFVSSTYRITG